MARSLRLKLNKQIAYYHIVSRITGKEYLLQNKEKDKLLSLIKYYSDIYFVQLISFAIMSNHFHILVRFSPGHMYNKKSIKKRITKRYGSTKYLNASPADTEIEKFREQFSDLSLYVKDIKQQFSSWYNRSNNRTGYLWGGRFKSVIFEPGYNLLQCITYIDLNAVSAGIVKKAEDYEWCSAYYRYKRKKSSAFLSFKGVFCNKLNKHIQFKEYYHFLKSREKTKNNRYSSSSSENVTKFYSKGLAVGSISFLQSIINMASTSRRIPVQISESKERKVFALKNCFD